MHHYLENLKWRYATKVFDPDRKVNEADITEVIEAIRLSASSYGLQPRKLFVVENQEIKNQIMTNAWNQTQVGQNSHLLVFTRPLTIDGTLVEKHIENLAKIIGTNRTTLDKYAEMLHNFVKHTPAGELEVWAREQIFLALGNVLSFLAEKKIDSCPIGGFDKSKIDEILRLEEQGYASVILLPIGYRSKDDSYATKEKVRFDPKEIVVFVK